MATGITGRVDQLHNTGNAQLNAAQLFKRVYDLLNDHPMTTRIALGYGSGGTGTGDFNDPAPFGSLAHAVFRFDTHAGRDWEFYVVIAKGNDSGSNALAFRPVGNSPTSSYGYVVANAAVGIGGDGNPWQGTTNNDGTDTLPATWWGNPSGGTNVKVTPSSNSSSGTGSSEGGREVFTIARAYSSLTDFRAHVWVDDDGLYWATDYSGALNYPEQGYIGAINTPNPNLNHPNPLFGCEVGGSVVVSQTFNDYSIGAAHVSDTEANWETVDCKLELPAFVDDLAGGHEQTGTYDTWPFPIFGDVSGHRGFMGWLESVQYIYGRGVHDTSPSLDRVVLGAGNAGNRAYPWDGVTTPGTTMDRDGVTF